MNVSGRCRDDPDYFFPMGIWFRRRPGDEAASQVRDGVSVGRSRAAPSEGSALHLNQLRLPASTMLRALMNRTDCRVYVPIRGVRCQILAIVLLRSIPQAPPAIFSAASSSVP